MTRWISTKLSVDLWSSLATYFIQPYVCFCFPVHLVMKWESHLFKLMKHVWSTRWRKPTWRETSLCLWNYNGDKMRNIEIQRLFFFGHPTRGKLCKGFACMTLECFNCEESSLTGEQVNQRDIGQFNHPFLMGNRGISPFLLQSRKPKFYFSKGCINCRFLC